MKILNKILKLLGARSPSLERWGYYSCINCVHSTIQVSNYADDDVIYCLRKNEYVKPYDTCRKAKSIEIKPLKTKHYARGLRANTFIIDEWSGGKDK